MIYFEFPSEEPLLDMLDRKTDILVFRHVAKLIDPNTGMCGDTHAVSNAGIAARLSDAQARGRNRSPLVFTAKMVRSSIDRLCELGLLRRESKQLSARLKVVRVFWAKCLQSPSFAQNELGKELGWFWARFEIKKPLNTSDLEVDSKTKGAELGNELGIYNIPSFLPSNNPTTADSPSDAARFKMNVTWQPSDDFMKAVLQNRKTTPELIDQVKNTIMEFRLYWREQNSQLSQSQWEQKLFKNDLRATLEGRGRAASVAASGGNVTPITAGKGKRGAGAARKPIKIPYNTWGEALQAFGMQHGFRACKPGEGDVEYRRALQVHLERMNHKQERAHG